MKKAFKYRLRPSAAQDAALAWTLDRCRELYNAGLQEKRDAYKLHKTNRSRKAQQAELTEIKRLRPEYVKIHSQVLQNVFVRLHRAFDGFFRRVKEFKAGNNRRTKPGYPRFKSCDRYASFTFPQVSREKELTAGGVVFKNGRLIVNGVPGALKIILHRPWQGTPKTATFKREGERWYVIFSCDNVPVEPRTPTGDTTGIDVGLESFAALDDGTLIRNPTHHRDAEPRLIKAQRLMSRRQKGSKRRRKANVLYAKHCRHVANSRRDFHHKTARALVRKFDRIAIEDLNVEGMARGFLAKSVHDAGWSQFFSILISKAESAGCEVVKVEAAGTSQECAACGALVRKSLGIRVHDCPECGFKAHRDINAALNIRQRAFGARPGAGLRGDGVLRLSQDGV